MNNLTVEDADMESSFTSPVIGARSASELEESVSRCLGWGVELRQMSREREFSGRLTLKRGEQIAAISADYSCDIRARSDERPANLHMMLIEQGGVALLNEGTQTSFGDNSVVLINTQRHEMLTFLGNSRTTCFTTTLADLLAFSVRIYGEEIYVPFETLSAVDVDSEFGGAFRNMLRMLGDGLSLKNTGVLSQVSVRALEEAALIALLDHLRLLSDDQPQIAACLPPTVRMAIEFMLETEHLILVSDVAASLGVSVRALQIGFLNTLGLSPHDYLKRIRLRKFRRDLLLLGPGAFKSVARHWGFTNSYRLKHLYLTYFGEHDWKRVVKGATSQALHP
jgi:AraC-like DNA-binding protein